LSIAQDAPATILEDAGEERRFSLHLDSHLEMVHFERTDAHAAGALGEE
jgi:hypothetical protein